MVDYGERQAFNSGRYQRQTMVRDLQNAIGRMLLSYTAAAGAPIDREDILPFVDLLHHVPAGADIDLLLHTGGGDIDATEKIAAMLWSKIGATGTLRVIVPDYAKSASTLLALAADRFVMSDSSELGPIDVQVVRPEPSGAVTVTAVQHHLDAFKRWHKACTDDPSDAAAALLFAKFEPAIIQAYESVIKRASQLSDKHLKEGMFRRGHAGAYTAITAGLLDTNRWLTHSQMIGQSAAAEIGLNVDYRTGSDPEWQIWWRIHCHQRLALDPSGARKLFESDPVCLQLH